MSECCCGGTINRIDIKIDNRDRAIFEPESKIESKIEPKIETETKIEPEVEIESKVESKVEPRTDVKIDTKVDTKAKSRSKSGLEDEGSNGGGGDGGDGGTMTICHETPSGQRNTLVLPTVAALTHLEEHELDTIGPCEEEIIEPIE